MPRKFVFSCEKMHDDPDSASKMREEEKSARKGERATSETSGKTKRR